MLNRLFDDVYLINKNPSPDGHPLFLDSGKINVTLAVILRFALGGHNQYHIHTEKLFYSTNR